MVRLEEMGGHDHDGQGIVRQLDKLLGRKAFDRAM